MISFPEVAIEWPEWPGIFFFSVNFHCCLRCSSVGKGWMWQAQGGYILKFSSTQKEETHVLSARQAHPQWGTEEKEQWVGTGFTMVLSSPGWDQGSCRDSEHFEKMYGIPTQEINKCGTGLSSRDMDFELYSSLPPAVSVGMYPLRVIDKLQYIQRRIPGCWRDFKPCTGRNI